MSSKGNPFRRAIANPSPVPACALLVVLNARPYPPVAKQVIAAWNVWTSPVRISYATHPLTASVESSGLTKSRTWYSS